jgi:hypothetical protein
MTGSPRLVQRVAASDFGFSTEERQLLDSLRSPFDVQEFLDALAYEPAAGAMSPRVVLRTRRGHCFSGAILAAAALRVLGYPPLLVDLRAVRDDDHVLAVFREHGCWGAVAKSNFTTLRFREPVYRSPRELAMSYFDLYCNTLGEKTLREYSVALDLRRFDGRGFDWMLAEGALADVEERIERIRHYPLLTPAMAASLAPVSLAVLAAGLLGSDPQGLYQVEKSGNLPDQNLPGAGT